jgi:hypothetical protein
LANHAGYSELWVGANRRAGRHGALAEWREAGSPRQNASSESFKCCFREDFQERDLFDCLTQARVVGAAFRQLD